MKALIPCLALAMLALCTLGLTGCGGDGETTAAGTANDPDTLRVALLPDEDPATIITNNEGFKKYLEGALGKKIELVVTTDYSSMIEAMVNKRIELGYFGPLSYCLAKTKADIRPFAAKTKNGSATYKSVLICSADSGINSIADIKGKIVAWGDQASTSSHLIPKSILQAEGLKPETDYQEHFVGSHDAVANAVQNGNAQAGGLSLPIFESLVERGIIDPQKVKQLQQSKPFPQYPWAMQTDLDPALQEKIKQAFLSLDDKAVLKPLKAHGFAPISDSDYNVVRDLAKILNLDLAKM